MKPRIFSVREASKYLNVSAGTLANWRCYGVGPSFKKDKRGRCIYDFKTLTKFKEGR